MFFSIITVCFNSEKTIERTIQSVLHQTYQDFEYIIIDGASTDGTLQIIHRYESLFDGKLRLLSEPDKGIYDAMNKGIKMASGQLIGIVNSDDYYEPDALEIVRTSYQNEKYMVLYGLLRTTIEGKEIMVYLKNHENLKHDMITHPTCFITRDTYEKFGVYSLKYPYSADYELMLRLQKHSEVKFKEIYHIISNFSLDGSSASVKAYRDTIRLKREYRLISVMFYMKEMIKTWLAMKLGR